jgi:RNA polymerase sigma-70 factor (ECF subfamily)
MRDAGVSAREVEVNAQPGITVLDPCGALINAMTVDVVDGGVQVLRSVINPDKLVHLGPLADVAALLKQHKRGER